MSQSSAPIRVHPANPHYFLYRDRPLVLVTATEHYGAVINRNFDYVRYLDEASDKKATLSRCFLLFRELQYFDGRDDRPVNPHSPCKPLPGEYVAPFLRSGPGFAFDGYPKFDLDQWNPEFFERLHGFLAAAAARGVIIELTLTSNTYNDAVWNLNPFNARNNVNDIGHVAWQDYNSMRDTVLFERQLAYIRKVVREVNRYDNCYFEVCNEPIGGYAGHATLAEVEAWQTAIREEVRAEEAALPNRHMVFQVPTYHWRYECDLDPLLANSDIDAINMHDYLEVTIDGQALPALGRFMQRDLRLDRINRWWTLLHAADKPVIFDEDNAATNGLDEGAWIVHRKRAWAVVLSGGHYDMIDFSIQVGGGEAGSPAARATIRTWLKHLSAFVERLDIVHMTPVRDFCSATPANTLAITLTKPGQEYALYLADRRETEDPEYGQPCAGILRFQLPAGSYEVCLYSPVTGTYIGAGQSLTGGEVSLAVEPFVHDTVLHIRHS
jgi:hypothetical protein